MGRRSRNAPTSGAGKGRADDRTHRRIEGYFQQIEATLTLFPQVVLKTMRYDQRSETKGFTSGVLHFADASELHVREFVDVSSGIDRFKYSYHYMRAGHLVFQYDNATDITAREFATYPHHPHVGEVIQASRAPALREVLEEIAAALP